MNLDYTLAEDDRLSLQEIYNLWKEAIPTTWTTTLLTTQTLELPSGEQVVIPIYAYSNAIAVDRILIGGIHGREPAGAIALAQEAAFLVEEAKATPTLILPLLNPWGYFHHQRYGPSGNSVTDCDFALGRSTAPASPESTAITKFLSKDIHISPKAAVLDLHEDPGYEEGGLPHITTGTYMYIIGNAARKDSTVARVKNCLQACALPLMQDGVTRFHEVIKDGIIENSLDSSIDEYLSTLGATPVITLETLLLDVNLPQLPARVDVYKQVIRAFCY